MLRSHTCGELNKSAVGASVTLCGWVGARRDHGNLIFIDVRDAQGITQVVFNPQLSADVHKKAETLRAEFVIMVTGTVSLRPQGTTNDKIPTGAIEVVASALDILNPSLTPPFEIFDTINVTEEARLKYRYLDLRRPMMQRNVRLRHKICKLARDYFDEHGFIEVETPILTKSTPEGARDYLVPSRVNPGMFYALPQSPQLFKQILMVSSLDRYFQIAKCFRDEDLRADRQPEFTQFDIEMSFAGEEDIFALSEGFIKKIFAAAIGVELTTPFPRMTYHEAMARFGCDKPDTRFGMELAEITGAVSNCQFKIFKNVIANGGKIIALSAPGCGAYTRGQLDELIEFAKGYGAQGVANFKVDGGKLTSQIDKFFSADELAAIRTAVSANDGDMIFIVADRPRVAYDAMAALRKLLGKRLGLVDEKRFDVLWVTDFPLFKYNDDEKRWESEHHPFTSLNPADRAILDSGKNLDRIRSRSYDLVINGTEIGSGSVRIHERELQELIFKTIGISDEDARLRFGFLLEAFKYGAPPHCGVAFGLDRLMTFFTGSDSIRDVIAFPKTQKAVCLMTSAPSTVDERQLNELSIKIKK